MPRPTRTGAPCLALGAARIIARRHSILRTNTSIHTVNVEFGYRWVGTTNLTSFSNCFLLGSRHCGCPTVALDFEFPVIAALDNVDIFLGRHDYRPRLTVTV